MAFIQSQAERSFKPNVRLKQVYFRILLSRIVLLHYLLYPLLFVHTCHNL